MVNWEELYNRPFAHPLGARMDSVPMARAAFVDQYCTQARAALCQLDASWCNASCETIQAKIQQDCSLFTGDNPIGVSARCVNGQWVGNCPGSQYCTGVPAGSTAIWLIAGAAVAGIILIAMMPRKKTITVGRLTPT